MAVFRVYREGSDIVWSLHRGTVGDPREVIARSSGTFATADAAKAVIVEIKNDAAGAVVDDETTDEVVTEGNVRVGKPKVVSKRVPSTSLASPSSIPTDDDDDANGTPAAARAGRAPRATRPVPRPARAPKPVGSGAKPSRSR